MSNILNRELKYLEDTGRVSFIPYQETKVAIFAGAGLSAESGLSTFRDVDGLWKKYNIDQICNIRTYGTYKEQALEFYNEVKANIIAAKPNPAHIAIANLQKEFPNDILVVTSNIDDLLEKAGCTNVLHVHGDCEHLSCTNCFHRFFIGDNSYDIPDTLKCPSCGRVKKLKPGVVFFGEQAPAYPYLLDGFANENITHRVLIGSTLQVNPPEFFSLDLEGKRYYVDQKPQPEFNKSFDEVIQGAASVEVPLLLSKVRLELLNNQQ